MKRIFPMVALAALLAGPAVAASPEQCIDKSASSADSVATFSFLGCPIVFNLSTKQAYVTFYGNAATTGSTPVAASTVAGTVGGVVGVCVQQTKVVHVIMGGSDTGTVRVCNYGGTQP